MVAFFVSFSDVAVVIFDPFLIRGWINHEPPSYSYTYSWVPNRRPPTPANDFFDFFPPRTFLLLFITPFLFQSPRLLRFEEFSTPSSPPFIPTPLLLDNQEYVSKISLFLCQNNSPNTWTVIEYFVRVCRNH